MFIGITGSEGLVGRSLWSCLEALGHTPCGIDLRGNNLGRRQRGDVRDPRHLYHFLEGLDGVIHLAAVSRILAAEKDPATCWTTNVHGTACLLTCVAESRPKPWVVVASSREVYGLADFVPVAEDTPLRPVNHYGRSKVARFRENARGGP